MHRVALSCSSLGQHSVMIHSWPVQLHSVAHECRFGLYLLDYTLGMGRHRTHPNILCIFNIFVCTGDTDSSSDFEAIPTPGGLKFRDTPSPTGSEFNTPPTSLVGRAASITDDEEDAQFGTPRASLAGSFRSGPQGSHPVQLHGPVFQVPAPLLPLACSSSSSCLRCRIIWLHHFIPDCTTYNCTLSLLLFYHLGYRMLSCWSRLRPRVNMCMSAECDLHVEVLNACVIQTYACASFQYAGMVSI